jgi:hypothetical protein
VPEWAIDLHVVVAHARVHPPYRSLVLSVTDRCNIACDFCCHPHLDSQIDEEECVRLATEACALDFVEVALTGGEPFLRFPLILRLAEICREHRRALSVLTNGFWARRPERAAEMAARMVQAGVFHVTFSWDPSHAAFVPAAAIQVGLDACMEAGLHVELRGNFVDPDDPRHFRELRLARWLPYASFSVARSGIAATGRARGKRRPARPVAAAPLHRCPGHAELEHVIYARDGMTMPCCSVWVGYETPAASLGSWRDRPLAESLRSHEADPWFRLIADEGFGALYRRVEATDPDLAGRLPSPADFEDPCSLCGTLLQGPDAAALLRAARRVSEA